jgi:hypothetical protein
MTVRFFGSDISNAVLDEARAFMNDGISTIISPRNFTAEDVGVDTRIAFVVPESFTDETYLMGLRHLLETNPRTQFYILKLDGVPLNSEVQSTLEMTPYLKNVRYLFKGTYKEAMSRIRQQLER